MSAEFLKIAEDMKSMVNMEELTDEDKLDLYKWYKQATVGDCNTTRPTSILDVAGKAKWDAWNGVRGTSQAKAEGKYLEKCDSLK